jgi:hypothetical protein
VEEQYFLDVYEVAGGDVYAGVYVVAVYVVAGQL